MIDQLPFQWIHVHVVKFFHSLLQTPHIEIIEAPLPEARQRRIAACKIQTQLSGERAPLAAQAARDALLQYLNHSGRRSLGRLADEQMNVLRHNHVAHQREAVVIARLAENLRENISGAHRAEQRQTSIASERDEMKMPASVVANEFVCHGRKEKSKPRPFKPERVGHPEKLNQSLRVDVPEWYYPLVRARQ